MGAGCGWFWAGSYAQGIQLKFVYFGPEVLPLRSMNIETTVWREGREKVV